MGDLTLSTGDVSIELKVTQVVSVAKWLGVVGRKLPHVSSQKSSVLIAVG